MSILTEITLLLEGIFMCIWIDTKYGEKKKRRNFETVHIFSFEIAQFCIVSQKKKQIKIAIKHMRARSIIGYLQFNSLWSQFYRKIDKQIQNQDKNNFIEKFIE